jgi:hypothetical protein
MDVDQLIVLISAAGAALAAAIGVLYKQIMSLSKDQSDLKHQVGRLEGEHDAVRDLSNRVLDSVHRAVLDRDRDRG